MNKKSAAAFSVSFLVMISLLLGGCTSLQRTELEPYELHSAIRSGELLKVGDRVQLVNADGSKLKLTVEEIDDQSIIGKDNIAPIDDVVALETKEISAGKTSLLVGGAVGMGFLIGALLGPALILAAAAP